MAAPRASGAFYAGRSPWRRADARGTPGVRGGASAPRTLLHGLCPAHGGSHASAPPRSVRCSRSGAWRRELRFERRRVDAGGRGVPLGAEENPPNYRDVEWAALRIPSPPPFGKSPRDQTGGARSSRAVAAGSLRMCNGPGEVTPPGPSSIRRSAHPPSITVRSAPRLPSMAGLPADRRACPGTPGPADRGVQPVRSAAGSQAGVAGACRARRSKIGGRRRPGDE